MTITLHWWLAPLVLLLIASTFFYRAAKASHPLDGAFPMMLAFAMFVGALGIALGHFL